MRKPVSRAIRLRLLLAAGLVAAVGCTGLNRGVETGTAVLITEEEAALPDEPPTRAPRTLPRSGPLIEVESPDNEGVYVDEFPIHVIFSPGPKGLAVNMESLKLTYKKLWGIDITDRVRAYISGSVIHVPATRFPEGRHRVEIYIEDVARNASAELLSVTVR